jgi:hypothetical protein
MRKSIAYATLLATLLMSASCADTAPSAPTLQRLNTGLARSLSSDIDGMIADFFPQGLETATGTRWLTIKLELASGNVTGARKHLNDLVKFIGLKTGNISTTDGETPKHAAGRLVYAMSLYVYSGPTTPVPPVGSDLVYAFVGAGQSATIVVPSDKAGVSLTSPDDRIVVISQDDPALYPAQCQGPQPYTGCQYPLFYKFESFPHTRLDIPAHFAVCMVTEGDRRPLDYPEQEPGGPVHQRMHLAHETPTNEADRTPGSTYKDGIEILALAEQQQGFVSCNESAFVPSSNPVLALAQRAFRGFTNIAGRILTPKDLYAYDQGPEHLADSFSNFNGVDPESEPDLAITDFVGVPAEAYPGTIIGPRYAFENLSRRNNRGAGTGPSLPTTAQFYLSSDAVFDAEDTPQGTPVVVPALYPDQGDVVTNQSLTLPTTPGRYYVIVHINANPGTEAESSGNNSAVFPVDVINPLLLQTGFEDGDPSVWGVGVSSPNVIWNRSALSTPTTPLLNAAFPSYVSTFGADGGAGGALPSPIAGTKSSWYGNPTKGNYIGTQVTEDAALSGGMSTGPNAGALVSPQFRVPNVPNATELAFKTWWEIESVNPHSFDIMDVEVVNVVTGAVTVARRLNPSTDPTSPSISVRRAMPYTSGGFNTAPAWQDVAVDLSAYRGQTIRLRFAFNTRDSQYNGFRGWIVDQVAVRVLPPLSLRALVAVSDEELVPADQMTFPVRPIEP